MDNIKYELYNVTKAQFIYVLKNIDFFYVYFRLAMIRDVLS